jgi:DNA-binding transcriptional LysR family regulator
VEQEVLDGRIDFYVGPYDRSNPSSQLSVEQLFDNRRMIVARRGHPLLNAGSIAELAEARWIRPTLSVRSSEADFDSYLRDMGIDRPRIVMHSRSSLATLVAVMTSDLLTVLPQQWLEFGPTAQGLDTFNVIGPMVAAPICIVRRSDLPLTPMAEHLSDLIRRTGEIYRRRRTDR